MNNKILMLLGTTLALAACGKHDSTNAAADTGNSADTTLTATDNGAMSANMAATAPSPLTAQGFVNAAAASDRFEIESSRLAAGQASSSAVKKFATNMISAHTQSTAKLKSIVGGLSPSITPDDTLTTDQQAALDSLKGQDGATFDKEITVDASALSPQVTWGTTPEMVAPVTGEVPQPRESTRTQA